MWSAIADLIVERRSQKPKVSAHDLSHELCLLTVEPMPAEAIQQTDEEQCQPESRDRGLVLDLGHDLILAAPFNGEAGSVFLLGPTGRGLGILWSIANTAPQPNDPHDLVGAWKPDRAGEACRDEGTIHKPGSCGPLYASLRLLPPDSSGRPRFYIDAGYAQSAGFTIGKQTTVWTWNKDHAELQWSDWYDYMIDQSQGTAFANGILSVASKSEFQNFYSCGMCAERQVVHEVLIEPTGVRDLGSKSMVPELDLVDTLFSAIIHKRPTSQIASSQVTALLRPQLLHTSAGMLDGSLVTHTATGATVCLDADEIGQFEFTLRRTRDGGYYVSHGRHLDGSAVCSTPAWLPLPSPSEAK